MRLLDGHSKYQINKQETVRRRLTAKLVLQWLYENGKSEYSPAMLLKEIQAVEMRVVGLLNIRDLHLIDGVRERNSAVGSTNKEEIND